VAEPEKEWIEKYRAALDLRPLSRTSALAAGWQRVIHAFGFVSRGESGPPVKTPAPSSAQAPERHRTEVHLAKNIASEKSPPTETPTEKKAS
jgi:hypothetical protein